MLFDKVVIVGIGLIGSSLARNLKKHRLARKVAVFDKNPAYLAEASELGIVDEVFDEPGAAAADADLIVLATPVGAFGALTAEMVPFMKRGAILTDVGSVKNLPCRKLKNTSLRTAVSSWSGAIRWPVRKNPVPAQGLRNCLKTVGVF